MHIPLRLAAPLALGIALLTFAPAGSKASVAVGRPHLGTPPVHQNLAPSSHPATRQQWQQYDTAAYVVSTLNLLTGETARSFSTRLRQQYRIVSFVVRSDPAFRGLYFIQLERSSGIAGTFAYKMGWGKPRALDGFSRRIGGRFAPRPVRMAYRHDPLRLVGAFGSTLPNYR